MDEITAIFADMGFSVAEGPDIETDFYNFTALNFPAGHPAREMHDTFFFNPDANGERKVLRTHTSPVQIRTMLAQKPPIRVIMPGRTYRCDSDQTHTPMFHQVEGLVIDKGSISATSNGCWRSSARRSSRCPREDALPAVLLPVHRAVDGSRHPVSRARRRDPFGEGDDWLEILGCGMVHPNVLRNCGLDPMSTRASPGAWASIASPC